MLSVVTSAVNRSLAIAQSFAIAVATSNMNSQVQIKRMAKGVFNETSRQMAQPSGTLVYDGAAGLTVATGSTEIDLGDEITYFSSITCNLPQGSNHIIVDDVIKVMASPDDDLVGRYFRVTDTPVGGRIVASINLRATGIVPSRSWAWS
jgi:hypothetical protein